jgi:hypothetical protein
MAWSLGGPGPPECPELMPEDEDLEDRPGLFETTPRQRACTFIVADSSEE